MENDSLSKIPPEDLVRMAEEEIERAKIAQKNGKPLPELTLISFVLFKRSFDRLPPSIWRDLSFLLVKVYRGKRGRPSTEQEDLALAKNYLELRKVKKDSEAISILANSRNHLDQRSTRRALARGKKLYEQEIEAKAMLWRESLLEKGIQPSDNALADLLKLAERTDKKE